MRLKHESIVREAFGNGILFALENLQEKPKEFNSMENLLLPFFKLQEYDSTGTAKKNIVVAVFARDKESLPPGGKLW